MKLITIFLLSVLLCPSAFALSDADAVKTIMGEARGESSACQIMMSEVLRRRNSTKGFYGFKAKFKEPKWVWEKARKSWDASEFTNTSNSATHFESSDFKVPYWAKNMDIVATCGKTKFYKE